MHICALKLISGFQGTSKRTKWWTKGHTEWLPLMAQQVCREKCLYYRPNTDHFSSKYRPNTDPNISSPLNVLINVYKPKAYFEIYVIFEDCLTRIIKEIIWLKDIGILKWLHDSSRTFWNLLLWNAWKCSKFIYIYIYIWKFVN